MCCVCEYTCRQCLMMCSSPQHAHVCTVRARTLDSTLHKSAGSTTHTTPHKACTQTETMRQRHRHRHRHRLRHTHTPAEAMVTSSAESVPPRIYAPQTHQSVQTHHRVSTDSLSLNWTFYLVVYICTKTMSHIYTTLPSHLPC